MNPQYLHLWPSFATSVLQNNSSVVLSSFQGTVIHAAGVICRRFHAAWAANISLFFIRITFFFCSLFLSERSGFLYHGTLSIWARYDFVLTNTKTVAMNNKFISIIDYCVPWIFTPYDKTSQSRLLKRRELFFLYLRGSARHIMYKVSQKTLTSNDSQNNSDYLCTRTNTLKSTWI